MRISELLEHVQLSVMSLSPDEQMIALSAFANLADSQRGEPESLGGGGMNSNVHLSGIYAHLTEHVGDLTHRMAQKYCEEMNFGYEYVLPKVRKALGEVGRVDGFRIGDDIIRQLRSNYDYGKSIGKITDDYERYERKFKNAGECYAHAHSKLVVYNEAQYNAREAAVTLGRMRYWETLKHLRVLFDHLCDVDTWVNYASQVTIRDGVIIPYR